MCELHLTVIQENFPCQKFSEPPKTAKIKHTKPLFNTHRNVIESKSNFWTLLKFFDTKITNVHKYFNPKIFPELRY